MTATARAYLNAQRADLGFRGGAPNGNHTPYGAITGYQDQAWCGSFQIAKARQVGLVLPAHVDPTLVDTNVGYAYYAGAGRAGKTPHVGAHVFYDWSGARNPGNIHHVEVVESLLPGGRIVTIGGNVNSAVMRVLRTLSPFVVGFGYPVYAPEAPTPVTTPHPAGHAVSLSALINAAHRDPTAPQGATTHGADVLPFEQALAHEGLLEAHYADGSYGTLTIHAVTALQHKLGFTGADADGIIGPTSLKYLANKYHFTTTA